MYTFTKRTKHIILVVRYNIQPMKIPFLFIFILTHTRQQQLNIRKVIELTLKKQYMTIQFN